MPKVRAAIDAGRQEVVMPKEYERDVQMTPEYLRDRIKLRFVSSIEEVLEAALLKAS
jgi:predicted ATP-dependent protease